MNKEELVQKEYADMLKQMIEGFAKFDGKIIIEVEGSEYFLSDITNVDSELILHADID